MTKTYKIREIFLSIQGEGPRIGMPAMFVRFSGCNLSCDFCDTDHDRIMTNMEASEIVHAVEKEIESAHLGQRGRVEGQRLDISREMIPVIFTGGEPLLQLDGELLAAFHCRQPFHLETNGSVDSDVDLSIFEEVVVSPKNLHVCDDVLVWATCLKVLSPFPGDLNLDAVIAMTGGVDELIIQPITPAGPTTMNSREWKANFDSAYQDALELYRRSGKIWRVVPQLHRLMGIR